MSPVTSLAALATSLSVVRSRQDLGVAVVRRERDAATAAATKLIENLEAAAPTRTLPDHLGRHVNIVV